jgi:hypothetical protein
MKMNTKESILAFSQSEKIKAGIIWVSHLLELLTDSSPTKPQGGQKIIRALADMILMEIQLAKKLAQDPQWVNAEKHIEQAIVMINSGVSHDSIPHFTQALSQVTSIGQRSMMWLQGEGLI